MSNHIELDRTFIQLSQVQDQLQDIDTDLLKSQMLFNEDSIQWVDLLSNYRVVILAEAGTGKTHEMQTKVEELRSNEKYAFFIRLEDLATDGFEIALQKGNFQEFQDWINSDVPAWFFIDSVDEARLKHPRYFEKGIRIFGYKLGPQELSRAHIYISSRVSDWRANSDLKLIYNYLPHFHFQTNNGDEQLQNSDPDNSNEATSYNFSKKEKSEVQIVTLTPLDIDQIRKFALGCQTDAVEDFIHELQMKDTIIFAERPQDLFELITYWKKHKKIDTYEKMMEFNVNNKIQESNIDRQSHPLSDTKAFKGVKLLSSALTFTKTNSILLPDQPMDQEQTLQDIDPKILFPEWEDNEIKTLISRAIFDVATYGRVRFHHRSIKEYLTARWLWQLLDKNKSRRAIENILFDYRYGLEVMIPSMKPISAWLALWDDHIRNKILRIEPGVLIEYGDPGSLNIETRDRLLRQFASYHMKERSSTSSFDNKSIHRLADPKLSSTLLDLMEEYPNDSEIQDLLLLIIWQGEIVECAESALSLALDSTLDSVSRSYAIKAVESAGNSTHKKQIAEYLVENIRDFDRRTISFALESIFPEYLNINDLVEIIEKIDPPFEYSYDLLSSTLTKIIPRNLSYDEQVEVVAGFVELLNRKPHIEHRFFVISEQYKWILGCTIKLAEYIIKATQDINFSDEVLRAIELGAKAKFYCNDYRLDNNLDQLIDEIQALRHKLFWRAVYRERDNLAYEDKKLNDIWYLIMDPALKKFKPEDFELFLNDIHNSSELDNKLIALSMCYYLWKINDGKQEELDQIKNAIQNVPTLEGRLQQLLEPMHESEVESQIKQKERELEINRKEQEIQQEQVWKQWKDHLQSNPDRLRQITKELSDDILEDLYSLVRVLMKQSENDSKQWGNSNWNILEPIFGREVAEATRDGLIAFWRLYYPPLLSEKTSNNIPLELITGLHGIWIEYKEKSNWAEKLSVEEAKIAFRYALTELNLFPEWTMDLLEYHSSYLDKIVKDELNWECNQSVNISAPHYIMSALRYGQEAIRNRYRPYVFELIEDQDPIHIQTLDTALSILLSWEDLNATEFIKLAKCRYSHAQDEQRGLIWLTALMCIDGKSALNNLQNWISQYSNRHEAQRLMVNFCNSLISFREIRFGSIWRDFERVEILKDLVFIIFKYIKVEYDQTYGGSRIPNDRKDAQSVRDYLLDRLYQIPGIETYKALIELSEKIPHDSVKKRLTVLSQERAALDSEFSAWPTKDVRLFAEQAEKSPQTPQELFKLAIDRLDDIKYDLEEGDESEAEILKSVNNETDIRKWLASRLRLSASSKYNITSEQELADSTRTDIRFYSSSIDAPVTIELKITDKWSHTELEERLKNQLVGQYLRDYRSQFGIYMLINQSKKRWKIVKENRYVNFQNLIKELQIVADEITEARSYISEIKIIGIDLNHRISYVSLP